MLRCDEVEYEEAIEKLWKASCIRKRGGRYIRGAVARCMDFARVWVLVCSPAAVREQRSAEDGSRQRTMFRMGILVEAFILEEYVEEFPRSEKG